jgi:GAF domain-containing protein
VSIVRYEADGAATELASFSQRGELFPVGTRWSLEGTNVVAQVRESGRPARIDDYSGLDGMIAETARRTGIRSTVGIPIVVAAGLWGAMVVSSTELEPLPEGTEARLAGFTELAATAISNAESRTALGRLADEQAALRRVATLVARGAPPAELFSAVCEEVGQLLGADQSAVGRFEPDGPAIVLVGAGQEIAGVPVGTRWELDDALATTAVFRTGRAARVDESVRTTASGPVPDRLRRMGIGATVASPIVVEGRLCGAMTVSTRREPLPPDTEERLANFTELVATAIANTESRVALGVLADE